MTKQNEKLLRILFLADAKSIHTQRWVKYFADKGFEVHLVSNRSLGSNNVKNINLHLLSTLPQIPIVSYLLWFLLGVIQTKKLIRVLKPDLIHAHFVTDYGLIGALSGFHPFVLTCWGSDILLAPKESKICKFIVRYVLNKADSVTCDGENSKHQLLEFGINPKKIELILHGVDTGKFRPAAKNEEMAEELRISNSPVVISIRGLYPVYDVETIVRSIPLVLEWFPQVKFLIAGDGRQKEFLKSLAFSLGVDKSIRFIGQIPHDKLPDYLTLADIYVSTSLSEGGASISLLEAMACGLPVVVTDVGDHKRWIENERNGFIVETKDPKSLAEKSLQLLRNGRKRRKYGIMNRKIVERRADYYKEMKKIEKLYLKLEDTSL